MGRFAAFLLVLIVVGLGARVLFVDARAPEELAPPGSPQVPLRPVHLPETPPPQKPSIIDPDPDLDQNNEPADCQGTPELPLDLPLDPDPAVPPPH